MHARRLAQSSNYEENPAVRLRSELLCSWLEAERPDMARWVVWMNSLCLVVLTVGWGGMRSPRPPARPLPPRSETVSVPIEIFQPPPPPELTERTAAPDLNSPAEPAPALSSIPAVAMDDPSKVAFAVPVLNVTSVTNRVDLVTLPPRRDVAASSLRTGPVRWEGSVSQGVTGGYFPRPDYPREAIIKHESGTVEVLVEVGEDGTVTSAEVQSPSGSGSLDRQAVQFLKRKWRWPAGGQRKYIVPVEFSLQQ